ncbi:hypothetical protein G6L68_25490 [Agrobacterium fabrum]|uniref:hypothetical protein n=1 Tax=Agrobacterium fabrum TaxID=1176649 RepID=UPI000EF61DDC|nr:hypothetical protein [Agrobacterium fabrum]AYM66141.1 hypothetical protein At12D13_49890 [Agrobacterium fabrum]NTE63989.1 hypothetical protein [Agrobacterium fabrum]
MADQIIKPHPHIEMRGGFVRIVDDERHWINGLLLGLKNKDAQYVFDFDGLRHRCQKAESALKGLGIPEDYWNGISFYSFSRGPGAKYPFNGVVGIGAKVQRQGGEWVLLDAYKTPIAKTQTIDPVFNQFTAEQWEQATDFSDSPYRRPPEVKFTVTK